MSRILVMAGTGKGAFFWWSDERRRSWRLEGPLLKGWEVNDLVVDLRGGEPVVWAAVGHYVYGATVQRSRDLGRTWTQIEDGPRYAEEAGRKLERIWRVQPGRADEPDELWAGVAEAGLFVSRDGGESWREVAGLNDHPTRPSWQPGAGGLCCHTILLDPADRRRMWVAISAVGAFRSDDGGATWQVRNQGLPIAVPAEAHPEVGSCVHKMVVAPDDPRRLYQQNHQGVLRSADAGDTWERIEDGLPSRFGFPMVMHPADSRTLYILPLESDEYRFFPGGAMAVYRSRDGGDSWQPLATGLPADGYTGVLRNAMAVDALDPCGVYFGTSGGQLFASADEGESWHALPGLVPRISCVSVAVVP
jgi:hypothetical protein